MREYERKSSRKRMCVDDRWITTDSGRGISCKDRIVLNEVRMRYFVHRVPVGLAGPEQIHMLMKIR